MDAAPRVQQVRSGFAPEHAGTIADLDEPERERFRDRRRGKLARDHSLEQLPAGHFGNVGQCRDPIIERWCRGHAYFLVDTNDVDAYKYGQATASPQEDA